jgi:hypothetical protein
MSIQEFRKLQSVYKKILLTPTGLSKSVLMDLFKVDAATLDGLLADLSAKGLVQAADNQVSPVSWWEKDHLELYFSIPYVDDKTFYEYCLDLDALAIALQEKDVDALRPLSSEFSIMVLFHFLAKLPVGDLVKGFFEKAGEHLAEFVARTVEQHGKSGVEKIVIEGHTATKSGGIGEIKFRIEGKNRIDIMKELDLLVSDLKAKQPLPPDAAREGKDH